MICVCVLPSVHSTGVWRQRVSEVRLGRSRSLHALARSLAPLSDPLTRKRVYPTFIAEHTAPEAYKYCFNYVCAGFLGIGSI